MGPDLYEESRAFLQFLEDWHKSLEPVPLSGLLQEAGGPEGLTIFCVDVIEGFCRQGPLASPRVGKIVGPIAHLFRRAHQAGVRHFLLPQDSHPPDSPQFADFGPHCIAGSREASTVQELTSLPFAGEFVVFPKRSINSFIGTRLEEWLMEKGTPRVALVVGDCTDLCLHQLAMHLRLRANAMGLECWVVVPEDCVQTYHLGLEQARALGVLPHPGDLMHLVFLYHLRLNGVRVVRAVV